jgi:hypothetical protein
MKNATTPNETGDWSMTIEPFGDGWCWEIAQRQPDVFPGLESWKVVHDGIASSRQAAQAQVVEAVRGVAW